MMKIQEYCHMNLRFSNRTEDPVVPSLYQKQSLGSITEGGSQEGSHFLLQWEVEAWPNPSCKDQDVGPVTTFQGQEQMG